MNEQKTTGWGIIVLVLILLWFLDKIGFFHGRTGTETTVVQSGIVGGDMNSPTVTTYPDTSSGCCS